MSDFFEKFSGSNVAEEKVCAVAYTLNNEQPVICTYISDQPFFYLDFEDDLEDEDDLLFDSSEMGISEDDIRALKKEIEALEQIAHSVPLSLEEQYNLFAENAESICSDFSMSAAEKDIRIVELKEIMAKSRLGQAYLDLAEKHEVGVILTNQIETGIYDRKSKTISINPFLDKEEQVLIYARELRRHWQHRNGALINPMTFQPEHSILINRAQEADLVVSVIRIAWELQLAGIRDVWERVENSPMNDLARSFAREAYMDFRTINNGVAAAAVFESWFLSERCRQMDREIIQSMLADYNGYVFENIESSKSVTAELIAALGTMPFGKNYLAIHAVTIMEDPIFTEVRDRSNANFLWFIKFERSYKETERYLQNDSDLSTHDVRHDIYGTHSQDKKHEQEQSAKVIELLPNRTGPRGTAVKQNSTGGEIIHISHWVAKR